MITLFFPSKMLLAVLIVIALVIILIIVLFNQGNTEQSNKVGLGEDCKMQGDCSEGLVCANNGQGKTVCGLGLGQACDTLHTCSSGLTCSPTLNVCVPIPIEEKGTITSGMNTEEMRKPTPLSARPPPLIPITTPVTVTNPPPIPITAPATTSAPPPIPITTPLTNPPPIPITTPLTNPPPIPITTPVTNPAPVTDSVPIPITTPVAVSHSNTQEQELLTIQRIKEVSSIPQCRSEVSSCTLSARTGCSQINVLSDVSINTQHTIVDQKDIPPTLLLDAEKNEGRKVIEVKDIIDACNFSDRIVCIKKNAILKLPPASHNFMEASNTHSYAEQIDKLKDITIIRAFAGYLYVVAQGYLYSLDMRTYNKRKWKWIQCSWAPTDIDNLSVPHDDSLLWIHTKGEKAFIWDGKKCISLEDNRRRIYGKDANRYLSFNDNEVISRPDGRSFPLMKDAIILHDSTITGLYERETAFSRLCLLDWKVYYIATPF